MKTMPFLRTPFLFQSLSLFCLSFFFFATSVYAIQSTVLVQGKVTDEKTSAPVVVQYKITGSSGKSVKGKTIATDGSFKQILQAGETYTISFFEYNVFKSSSTFTLASSEKYYEDKKDFTVRMMRTGDVLLSSSLFDINHPNMKSGVSGELDKVIALMKENRSLEVTIAVAADEVPKAAKKPAPAKAKKSGKKKGTETVAPEQPAPDPNIALVEARITTLRAQFEQADAGLSKRVDFTKAPAPNSAANVVITIGEIKNKFE